LGVKRKGDWIKFSLAKSSLYQTLLACVWFETSGGFSSGSSCDPKWHGRPLSLEALEKCFDNMLQASRGGEGDELPRKLATKLGGAKEVRSLPDERLTFDDEGIDFEAQAAFHIE
jgi:hypothetical protein